jgi:hypothetical protein
MFGILFEKKFFAKKEDVKIFRTFGQILKNNY